MPAAAAEQRLAMKSSLVELDAIISNLQGATDPDVLQAVHAKEAEKSKILAALKDLKPIKTKVAIAMTVRDKVMKAVLALRTELESSGCLPSLYVNNDA
jgi:hypothetical protein